MERRDGYPAALSISAWLAENHNSMGGKRPPKEPSQEAPLEPHEQFTAHEKLLQYLGEFAPRDLLQNLLERQNALPPHLRGVTPATAEGVMRAAEGKLFNPEDWPLFSLDYLILERLARSYTEGSA